MAKVTGELFDLYFLLKRDQAETSALMADRCYYMSRAEVDEFYYGVLQLQDREYRNLWSAICREYGLDPSREYALDRSGNVIPLSPELEEALTA